MTDRPSHIYVIEHTPSGRVYVGKANNVERRWRDHLKESRAGGSSYLHNAIRKHGASEFSLVCVLPFVSEKEAFEAEATYVRLLHANVRGKGFNLDSGGQGGITRSAETCAKLGAIHRGKIVSPETRAKQAAAKLGTKRSPDTRAKIGIASAKRKHTAETRLRMSEIARNRSPEQVERAAAAQRGKSRPPPSDAARLNMSNAQKRRNARVRAGEGKVS